MLFASLIQLTYNDMLQNEKTRLAATFPSLKPDCSFINVAEKSNQPEDWLLHPIGYVFQFKMSIDFFKTALNEKDAEILKLQKKIEKLEQERALWTFEVNFSDSDKKNRRKLIKKFIVLIRNLVTIMNKKRKISFDYMT